MITKKIELNKLGLPILPSDIVTQIFGRLLENPNWPTLGRAARVCKGWQTEIIKIYPYFLELSNIPSRFILYVSPITKFWLKIVGDCRQDYTYQGSIRHYRKPIPYGERMSRAEIQQRIVELEQPSSEIQVILKRSHPSIASSSFRYKEFKTEILQLLAERRKLWDKINDAVNGSNEEAWAMSNMASMLGMVIAFVSYIATFDKGGRGCLLVGSCSAFMGQATGLIGVSLSEPDRPRGFLSGLFSMINCLCLIYLLGPRLLTIKT